MPDVHGSGRNIVVTGAGGGIGSALVRRLDQRGDRVFAGIRRREDAARLPRSAGVTPVAFDLADEDSVLAAAAAVRQELGGAGLHALVNNAGMIVHGPLELVSTAALRAQFEVNVIGQLAVTRAFLPQLRAARGRIVNIGASTGRVTIPFLGPISASKTALESLSDALRMELAHFGVDVTIVEPGAIDTEIFAKAQRRAGQDLGGAPAAVRELYGPAMASAEKALTGSTPSPVEVAVNAIIKALTDRKPAPRYLAGRDARLLNALRHLPDRVRDRVLMNNLGLRQELFRGQPAASLAQQNAAT